MKPTLFWHIKDILSGRRTFYNSKVTPQINKIIQNATPDNIFKKEIEPYCKNLLLTCCYGTNELFRTLFNGYNITFEFQSKLKKLTKEQTSTIFWIISSKCLEILCNKANELNRPLHKQINPSQLFEVLRRACDLYNNAVIEINLTNEIKNAINNLDHIYEEISKLLGTPISSKEYAQCAILMRGYITEYIKNFL